MRVVFRATPLSGEGEGVTGLAAGPGILAASGRKGKLAVMDSSTGRRIFISRKVGKGLTDVFVSADGNAVMATDAALSNFIWKRTSGRFKYYRHWHRKTGSAQALSRTGRILIREDLRKSVRWYEWSTRKMKELMKGTGVTPSGDGRKVAVRNLKGVVEVRDAATGRRLHTVGEVPKDARLGLDASGELLVVLKADPGSWVLEVVEVATGNVKRRVGPVQGKAVGLAVSGTAPISVVRTTTDLTVVDLVSGAVSARFVQPFSVVAVFGFQVFAVSDAKPTEVVGFRVTGVARTAPGAPADSSSPRKTK